MFKINIASNKEKGRTIKIESDSEAFIGLKIGDAINGKDVLPQFEGYEFVINGASDKAGFPSFKDTEGTGLRRVLLTYGKGMKEKKPHGLKRRKTVRGNTISPDIVQINLIVKKEGSKPLSELFPAQKAEEKEEKSE